LPTIHADPARDRLRR